MTAPLLADGATDASPPVAAYKTILREVIDRRPSGMRRRLSIALGKHRSFVTQITNPAYAVPIPAQHLATIFEVCHFAPHEREAFLAAYARAHPGRRLGPAPVAQGRSLTLAVPDFGDPARNAAFDRIVADTADRLARFAEDLG